MTKKVDNTGTRCLYISKLFPFLVNPPSLLTPLLGVTPPPRRRKKRWGLRNQMKCSMEAGRLGLHLVLTPDVVLIYECYMTHLHV